MEVDINADMVEEKLVEEAKEEGGKGGEGEK